MDYTKEYFKSVVEKYGEVFFVLGSDREYEIHGSDSFEFVKAPSGYSAAGTWTVVRVSGIRDGEYLTVEFPLDEIEHHYTHKEV